MRVQMIAHKSDGLLLREHQKCKILIMVSGANRDETVQHFEQVKYYGYRKDCFVFFEQTELPAVFDDGRIVMKSKHEPAMSPNGNGAFFDALNTNK